jgi:hypothetical protein
VNYKRKNKKIEKIRMEVITITKQTGRVCWQIPNKWGIPHIGIKGKWVRVQKKDDKWVPYDNIDITNAIKNMTIKKSPVKKTVKKIIKKTK